MNDVPAKPASIRVTPSHARELGYCAKGMRRWFDGRDRSWAQFVEHGIEVEWFEATDDAMAMRLAKFAQRAVQADESADEPFNSAGDLPPEKSSFQEHQP
jgi:hypothetical protein